MMWRKLIFGTLLAAALFAAADAAAQKYPERRMARDGNRLFKKGDFEGAETEYRRALESNPDFGEARFNLAGPLFKQQKADEAARIYAAFATDSTAAPIVVADANYNLGNVMLAGQKIQEAIDSYKQALRINPEDQQAKFNLAYAQKLLQQQQDNQDNQDQNQDQDNQDNQDNQDQNQDKDNGQDDQDNNGDQNRDNRNQDNDDGKDDQNQDNKDNRDDKQDQGDKPSPSGNNEAGIDPQDAQQMLEAIQDEEDKTREKINAKEVPTVGRSGKNW